MAVSGKPCAAIVAPIPKLQFTTVAEARAAIAADKLACVYVRAHAVFVVTAFGSGTFSRAEWGR